MASANSKLVLVVDDDPAICQVIKTALLDEGYQVQVAANGALALDEIARKRPNLIILDMRMPVMDGWAFLEIYCKQEPLPAPVITTSANTSNIGAVACSAAYLGKPFNLDTLLDMVSQNIA